MNSFALEAWDDGSSLVTFYTVRREGSDLSETDKFMQKFGRHEQYGGALQELMSLLFDTMGEQFGAHPTFFSREENRVMALPPSKARLGHITFAYPHFSLRLFCYRLSENLVILFNGGPKTAATAQQSEDLHVFFIQANDFAKRIQEALDDGMIMLDANGRSLVDFQGNTDIYF